MAEETSTPEAQPERSMSEIAQEAFGSGFHGEVKESPKEAPEEVSEEAPKEVTKEVPTETSEEASPDLPEEAPPELERETISTVRQLIESSDFDPEWFNSLEIDVKVDGESSSAKFSDVVKSYQLTQAAEKRLDDAKEKAKAQYQALANKQQELETAFQVAAGVLQRQKTKIDTDAGRVDWEKLRVDDPAEWSARQQEFANRKAAVDVEVREIATSYQQYSQKVKRESDNTMSQNLTSEHESLLEKLPEWADAEVAKTEQAAVGEYLITQGFSPEEVAKAYDHRQVVMARKAMLFDQMNNKVAPAQKKLKMVPKTLRSGTTHKSETNQTQKQDLINVINANPNSRAAEDAGVALLKLRRSNS